MAKAKAQQSDRRKSYKKRSKSRRPQMNIGHVTAIHWFAMEINQVALEILATDPKLFDKVRLLLEGTVDDLEELINSCKTNNDCPDGYWCRKIGRRKRCRPY